MPYDPDHDGQTGGFDENAITIMCSYARLGHVDKVLGLVMDAAYRLPLASVNWKDCTGRGSTRRKNPELSQFLRNYSSHKPEPPLDPSISAFRVVSEGGYRSLVQWAPARDNGLVTVRHIDGSTSLHIVCEINNTDLIEDMLSFGADPNVQRRDGLYPVQIAARKGNYIAVNHLLEFGSRFNIPFWNEYLAIRNPVAMQNLSLAKIEEDDGRYLYLACESGDTKLVEHMIFLGVNLNRQRKADGYYPLHVAAEEGNPRMISLLIQYGADVNLTSRPFYGPLLAAIDSGHFEAARMLLSGCPQPNNFPNDEIPPNARVLYFPEHPQGRMLLRGLMAAGANGHWADLNGFTMAHLVALHGSVGYTHDVLLTSRFNLGVISTKGFTPLWCAARNGHARVVEELLNKGVNTDVMPHDGSGTARGIAINMKWRDVIEVFEDFGVSR